MKRLRLTTKNGMSLILTMSMLTSSVNAQFGPGCSSYYKTAIIQMDQDIINRERSIHDLRYQISRLEHEAELKPLLGILGIIFAPAIAISGVALLSPLAIYSAGAALAAMAPSSIIGGASLVSGISAVRSSSDQKKSRLDQAKALSAQLAKESRILIEIKYAKYSKKRILTLLQELQSQQVGPESTEFVRRLNLFATDETLNAQSQSSQEVLHTLKLANDKQLICNKDFEVNSILNLERGVQGLIIASKTGTKVTNPFIQAEVHTKIAALDFQIQILNHEIKSLTSAKDEINSAVNEVERARGLPHSSRQERRDKLEALLNISNIIEHSLSVAIRLNQTVDQMKEAKTNAETQKNQLQKLIE